MHTYRLTPLSLWNAAASGLGAADVASTLTRFSRYPPPQNVLAEIESLVGRWGAIALTAEGAGAGRLCLRIADPAVASTARNHKALGGLLAPLDDGRFAVEAAARGVVKQQLLKLGWPVDDRAGFAPGQPLPIALREVTARGEALRLRPYQRDAVRAFLDGAAGEGSGGHGVVVLPCGAGKTLVGMAAMAALGTETLILATSVTAARQWIAELRDKTGLPAEAIGEYSGDVKQLRPVTVATYQILTRRRGAGFPYFEKLSARAFGLVIYDEVHLLPAPIFRLTAEIQARRRLGLTATLVREDRLEGEVFSLIGPKRFDAPWKEIEAQGFIAEATCYELRVPLHAADRARLPPSASGSSTASSQADGCGRSSPRRSRRGRVRRRSCATTSAIQRGSASRWQPGASASDCWRCSASSSSAPVRACRRRCSGCRRRSPSRPRTCRARRSPTRAGSAP